MQPQTPHLNIAASSSEHIELSQTEFVEQWRARFPSQSDQMMLIWIRALCTYDYNGQLPLGFLDPEIVKSERKTFNLDGKEFPAIKITVSELSRRRHEFMSDQKSYQTLRAIESYSASLAPEVCFLCEGIAQALDAKNFNLPKRDNLILTFNNCVVLPNRYPIEPLHSLIIPANHDDYSERARPNIASVDSKAPLFESADGKTRDAIVSREFLSSVVTICDTLKWGAIRNHVMDGKSVLAHDHFQTFPVDSSQFELSSFIFPSVASDSSLKIVVLDTTPFDTLFIAARDRGLLVDFAVDLLGKLERANEVFTVTYLDGRIAISPRRSESQIDHPIKVGAGLPQHAFDPDNDLVMENIFKYVPFSGKFDWSRYL